MVGGGGDNSGNVIGRMVRCRAVPREPAQLVAVEQSVKNRRGATVRVKGNQLDCFFCEDLSTA